MSFSDTKHLLYPVTLSLALVGGLALLQGFDPASDAVAGDPPYTQRASDLDGIQNPSASGPLFNTTAINQRNAQIELLSAILDELKSTRRLLEDGSARVTVESVDLDYAQIGDLIESSNDRGDPSNTASSDEVRAGSISASRAPGSGNGSGVAPAMTGRSAKRPIDSIRSYMTMPPVVARFRENFVGIFNVAFLKVFFNQ